jgi:hypothetical protein
MKRRQPASRYDAITRDLGTLGYDLAAEMLGKSDSLLRKYGDPACGKELQLNDAAKIARKLGELDEESAIAFWFQAQLAESTVLPLDAGDHLRRAMTEVEAARRLVEAGGPDVGDNGHAIIDLIRKLCDLADHQRAAREKQREQRLPPRLVSSEGGQ